jgi:hypothetical protein
MTNRKIAKSKPCSHEIKFKKEETPPEKINSKNLIFGRRPHPVNHVKVMNVPVRTYNAKITPRNIEGAIKYPGKETTIGLRDA